MGLYMRRGEYLEPIYFLGSHVSLFKKKAFPITEGLSGWVAQHARPIVNGNMSIECSYINDYLALNESYSEGKLLSRGSGLGKHFTRLAMTIAGVSDPKKKFSMFG